MLQGQAEQALKSFDTAIRHDKGAWGARTDKARLLESLGRVREASLCWAEAVRSMPAQLRESPQMQGLVDHARSVVTSNLADLRDSLWSRVGELMREEPASRVERLGHALDILTGRREFVTANPLFLPIPRLPAIPFFNREDFPWVPHVEAATQDIRRELEGVMAVDHEGFTPYVKTRQGSSSGQFAALDDQPAWSAYFLWKHGERIDAHCAACPVTAATVQAAPPTPHSRPRTRRVLLEARPRRAHPPPQRRELVRHLVGMGLSERRSLAVVRLSASAYRYAPRPDRNVELRARILALAQQHKRYGVGMIHLKLRQAGLLVNYKRVERLYQEAKLQVRRRKRKKVLPGERQPLVRPVAANKVWSMDFVFDRTAEGRVIKCLTIVDDATHEAVAIEVERAISGLGVIGVLDRLALARGLPEVIRTDNGKEFCGKAMVTWAHGRTGAA